ncbi:uncharacterized protein MELLADRAFT_67453 [Melampsora larici-populina 98AG31]|uniref:Uncharacterized protein n=1 Tax=Melampsora larici-populina (strain 98AG31 / pathotype 3-4-7) TaxID=747676 RepID=F4S374_MELLP|nr:uncharacterized protein MELLADRAFT_67453 [Melampsora larici-populina 98AG31]EGG00957.1 hypothetical protein MELLADRAFT_67453 [Melampsora larici-populina 98AG31]
MTYNESPSACTHPKLTHVTRDCSATQPLSNFNPSRYNTLHSDGTYSNPGRASTQYKNLPQFLLFQKTTVSDFVPRREMDTRHTRLPSLPLVSEPTLGSPSVFGDDYVPLSSLGSARAISAATERRKIPSPLPTCPSGSFPLLSASSLRYTRRAEPPIQLITEGSSVEAKVIIKSFHLPTSSSQFCGSPNSLSSESMSLPSPHGGVFVPLRTSSPQSQIISPPPERFRSHSVGTCGHTSVSSLSESYKTFETNGYVYRPTSAVLSDQYYYSQVQTKQLCKRNSSFSRVRRLSGSFLQLLKGGGEKN